MTLALIAFLTGVLVGSLIDWQLAGRLLHPRREDFVVRRILRRSWWRDIGVVLLVITAGFAMLTVATWTSINTARDFRDYVVCTAGQDADFAETYRVRTESVVGGFEALDPVVIGIARVMRQALEPDNAGSQRRAYALLLAAADQFNTVREIQSQTQMDNPPPPPPEAACGLPPESD